eukprot:1296506-Amphidinium_carterae.2
MLPSHANDPYRSSTGRMSKHAINLSKQALHSAIKAERLRRVTERSKEWKAELNLANGVNALARKMVRGSPPRLHVLTTGDQNVTCPKLQAAALEAFWEEVGEGQEDLQVHEDVLRGIKRSTFFPPPIMASDVDKQLRKARKLAANGPDWWRVRELLKLPPSAHSMLAALFNAMEKAEVMPRAMMTGWVKPIPKDGCVAAVGEVRPITLLSVVHRTWSSIRFAHLQGWCDEILDVSQAAFRAGRSTKQELQSILMMMNNQLERASPTYLGQLDLSKAFPRLNKQKACAMAYASGLPRAFVDFVSEACLNKLMCWKIAGTLSAPKSSRRGTPQGCAMSVLLFQILLAPVVRSARTFLARRCASSTIVVYADDVLVVCSSGDLLRQTMNYIADLLMSLDFVVNPQKSSITLLGNAIPTEVSIGGIVIPVASNPDIFGSTLTTSMHKLAAPANLPIKSSSRSIRRWIKIKERLGRLAKLPVGVEGKRYLWRAVVLPILSYDLWAVLPTKHSLESWSSLLINSVFSAVRGHKDKFLLAAHNPHQLNMLAIFVVTLARDALPLVIDEPLEAFFGKGKGMTFFTPLSAFVHMATLAGFQIAPEGLFHPDVNALLAWPPTSMDAFLHELRQTFRQLMVHWSPTPLVGAPGCRLDTQACRPLSTLSRTQVNFLLTLQANAHRSNKELICPLCDLPGGLTHALWECESRSLATVRDEPAEASEWPENFRTYCLLTTEDEMSPFEVAAGQEFMTRVLIERRVLQDPLDKAAQAGKRRRQSTVDAHEGADTTTPHQQMEEGDPCVGPLQQDHIPHPEEEQCEPQPSKRRKWDLTQLRTHHSAE